MLLLFANWMYVNSHFVVTTTFLIWLYLARNYAFYFVRNMFMVAMGLALVGYLVYPTPPRFLPERVHDGRGLVLRIAENSANVLYNPFAAVPSMHVAFALMISVPAFVLVRNRLLKALWAVYPAIVTLVVMVTANHQLDAAGALVAVAWLMPPAPPSRVPARTPGAGARPRQGARVTDELRERLAQGRRHSATTGARLAAVLADKPLTGAETRRSAHHRAWWSRGHPQRHLDHGPGQHHRGGPDRGEPLVLGGIAFILGSVCDMLDGRYSRMSGKGSLFERSSTPRSTAPQRASCSPPAAYFAQHQQQDDLATRHCAHRGRPFSVSYTRARAEALGVECKVGIASRAVRVVILSIGLVFGAEELVPGLDLLEPAIYVMVGLTIFTTFQRVWHVRGQLRSVQ